ncbi:MAG: 4'-phosphopantetheinyl transferase superfamily protein [Pirellulales bacterium]
MSETANSPPTVQPVDPSGSLAAAEVRPLVGRVLEHEPGRRLVVRRAMDLAEDLYALDHTLGGRDASAVDAGHTGLPVMPMAFSLEMMAEVAAALFPAKRVVGMECVRLRRWIVLDDAEPVTLEVEASVVEAATDGESSELKRVAVEIRDLGNACRRPAAPPAAKAVILLDEEYSEPPPPETFPLTDERPCPLSPEMLYDGQRRLFHGPLFQAVDSLDRMGADGIEGRLRARPRRGLFRSTAEPDLVTDPVLIDASTHILGAWHMSQPDPSGRVVFPYEIGTVRFFGPTPPAASRMTCRVRLGETYMRQVSHRIDLVGPDGRLWCRLDPAEYWRWYWPARYVDFFRRHDHFLLAEPWPAGEGAADAALRAAMTGDGNGLAPRACCMRLEPPKDLRQSVWEGALARVALSRREWRAYREMAVVEKRRSEWLFGRVAAKDAIRALWLAERGERLFPADIEIEPDPRGRPVAKRLGPAGASELPAVSISHGGGVATALAAFAPRVGLDVEAIRPQGAGFENVAFSAAERALLDRFGDQRDEGITRFWCAKEAVVKALGHGLADGPQSLAVRDMDLRTGTLRVALGPALTAVYPEFASSDILVRTARDGDIVVAVTFADSIAT